MNFFLKLDKNNEYNNFYFMELLIADINNAYSLLSKDLNKRI